MLGGWSTYRPIVHCYLLVVTVRGFEIQSPFSFHSVLSSITSTTHPPQQTSQPTWPNMHTDKDRCPVGSEPRMLPSVFLTLMALLPPLSSPCASFAPFSIRREWLKALVNDSACEVDLRFYGSFLAQKFASLTSFCRVSAIPVFQ